MADPTAGTPFSLTEWIMGALWAALAALIGIVWKRNTEDRKDGEKDLKAIEAAIAGFVTHREFEQHRLEDRYDFGVIHAKIDAMNGDLHRKIDTLGNNLNDSIRENQAELLAAIAQTKK